MKERNQNSHHSGSPRKVSSRIFLGAAAGLVLSALAVWGLFSYAANRRQHALEVWRGRLEAMADDRQTTMEAWLKERWGDARTLASFPTVQGLGSGQSADAEADKKHLAPILNAVARSYGYQGIWVLDERGGPLVAAPGSPPLPPEAGEAVRHSSSGQDEVAITYIGVRSGRARLGFIERVGASPTAPGKARPGWIFLAVDPSAWLFPLLKREPTPTRTGETVLAYRDGGDIVFLNPLRLRKTEALSFRLPLGTPGLAASAALQGRSGFGEYVDYRGVPVIASVRPIRGTDWGLVVKVDRAEALGPYRRSMAWQGLTLLLLLALLASVAIGQMRRLRLREIKAVLEERKRSEGRVLQLNRLLRTISEINQLIVRESERERLFSDSCRIIVENGGFVMAWLGLKQGDGTVVIAAKAGDSTGYLQGVAVRWDDTPEGRGPTGMAIRETRTVVNPDVTLNPVMVPWRGRALRAGFLSSAAFPIRVRGDVLGVLSVYAEEANAFGDEELKLLEELVEDLGFALDALEEREDRRRVEDALRASETRYRRLFESAKDGILILDCDTGAIVDANPYLLDLLGFTRDEVLGRAPWELGFLKDVAGSVEAFADLQRNKWVRYEDLPLQAKDGSRREVEFVSNVYEAGGARVIQCNIRDITERKKAEAEIQRLFEEQTVLTQTSPAGIILVNPEGRITFANPSMAALLGCTVDELVGSRYLDHTHTEQTAEADLRMRELMKGLRECVDLERRYVRRDGNEFWGHLSGRRLLNPDGSLRALVGVITDISEKKRAEEALKESEARYRSLFEQNVAGVYRSEVGKGLVECNAAFARMFGFASPAEAMKQRIEDFYVNPEELVRFRSRLVEKGTVSALESRCLRRDGSEFWVLENAILVHEESAGGTFVEGTCIDITDLKVAETTRILLSTAIEQSNDAVVITDVDGAILHVNPAFERVTGYSRQEVMGKNPRILKSGKHDEAFYKDLWDTLLSGETWSGRMVNRRKDGTLFPEFVTISPVRGPGGGFQAFVAVKRDVANEEDLERQLVEAKKLETVGMIASGVAHEVRNPLFAITTIVTALEKKLQDQIEYAEYVAHIKDQSGRLNALMNDLLTLGRPLKPEEFGSCLVGEAVHEAIAAIEDARAGSRQRFLLEIPRDERPVWGIKDKLVQVILNLLQNSLHFSPADRPIEVALRQDGSLTSLTVRDEGPGVPPNLLPRLFEPFQTGRKGGTGLGLAIVRQIVLAHGGSVEAVNNDPPPGATFTVRLPVHKPGDR